MNHPYLTLSKNRQGVAIYYIFYLYIVLLCTCGNLSALDRNFAGNKVFCASHYKLPEFASEVQQLLKFIPADAPCSHIECQKCGPVEMEVYLFEEVFPWAMDMDDEEYEDYSENVKILMCSCKRNECNKCENFAGAAYDMGRLSTWENCNKKGIYGGYFSEKFKKYFPLSKKNIEYTEKYKDCTCFWPEVDETAAKINNKAYQLFKNLFRNTAFNLLVSNKKILRNFFQLPENISLNLHGVTVACVCHCQHFSDYYQVCSELDLFAKSTYEEKIYYIAQSELIQILDTLYPLFIEQYNNCLEKHPHAEIEQEKQFIQLLLGQSSKSLDTDEILLSKDLFPKKGNNWLLPNLDFLQGVCFNEALLYESAIRSFNTALENGYKTRDIYIERAIARFESGQVDEALDDYREAKKLSPNVPFLIKKYLRTKNTEHLSHFPNDQLAFAQGIGHGAFDGLVASGKEFIPSTLSSITGLAQGLWAFAKNPSEVSVDLAIACVNCITYVSEHSAAECMEEIIPELKILIANWKNISDYEKGKQTGYIIGKYGVDIFGCTTALKGVKYYRELRRANALYTLEVCSASAVNRKIILEESVNRWQAIRQQLAKEANLKITWDKQGKHVVGHKNYNPSPEFIRGIFEHPDAQLLIDKFAGKGKRKNNYIPGLPGYVEQVDFGEHIGYYIHKDRPHIKLQTNKGTIRYAKDGVHIVPSDPAG